MAKQLAPTPASLWRRIVYGKPIPSSRAHLERLSLFLGLPVFASDALSSAAYATEAIAGILILASAGSLKFQMGLTIAICVLYAIVVASYQQTVRAYPTGGGAYTVAADNLGPRVAVVAGSALLIDYILTVAVSIAAGVAAIVSAFPHLHAYLIPLNLGAILLIAWANLRGVRESGRLFALPSYAFVAGMFVMIVIGVFKSWGQPSVSPQIVADAGVLGSEWHFPLVLVILRAFSAGCVALTGVEAISNGVPAFRAPEARHAVLCLRWLAFFVISMFLGTSFLIQHLPQLSLHATANPEYRTVVSQIAAHTFGSASVGFYFIQFATAAILILAANTAFADFPRLASILARDGYLPRPLARLGDRLVYQNGIFVLAAMAMALCWYFRGELDLLLPLYAVGVFTAFTISQSGMVRHWLKERSAGWGLRTMMNGFGAACTGVVAVVVLATKFAEGAWIVIVLMALTSYALFSIQRRYGAISRQLAVRSDATMPLPGAVSIVLVPRVHQGILNAARYAQLTGREVRGLHIALDRRGAEAMKAEWESHCPDIPLVMLDSPYRSLLEPTLEYIDQMIEEDPSQLITVVVAEAVAQKWYHRFLQENIAQQLKRALGRRGNVVVANVRYFLK